MSPVVKRSRSPISPGPIRLDADGNLVEGTNIFPSTTINVAMIKVNQRVCL
jgi:hypothetical protein